MNTFFTMWISSLSAAVFLTSTTANAASFSCERARSYSEVAVCVHPELSSLDDTLASTYTKVYAMAKDPQAIASARDEEWHWRQIHCHDYNCVFLWYSRRLGELNADLIVSEKLGDHSHALIENVSKDVHKSHSEKSTVIGSPDGVGLSGQPMAKEHGFTETMAKNKSVDSGPGSSVSAAENAQRDPLNLSLGNFSVDLGDAELTKLSHAKGNIWPGLPPLPVAPSSSTEKFAVVNKSDRPSARTIAVHLGF